MHQEKARWAFLQAPEGPLHSGWPWLFGWGRRRMRTFIDAHDHGDLLQEKFSLSPPKALRPFLGLFQGFPWKHFLFLQLECLGGKGLCLGALGWRTFRGPSRRIGWAQLNRGRERGPIHLAGCPGQDKITAPLIS